MPGVRGIGTTDHTGTVGATAQNLTDQGVTVPAAANYAEGYVRGSTVSYLRHSETPTASDGHEAFAGDTIILRSLDEINGFRAIRVTSTSPTIDWSFGIRS